MNMFNSVVDILSVEILCRAKILGGKINFYRVKLSEPFTGRSCIGRKSQCLGPGLGKFVFLSVL